MFHKFLQQTFNGAGSVDQTYNIAPGVQTTSAQGTHKSIKLLPFFINKMGETQY